MSNPYQAEDLDRIVHTLIESQAIMASSLYVELTNLGLMEPASAAKRLRALGAVAGSPLQSYPRIAAELRRRLDDYAAALDGDQPEGNPRLRVIDGGRVP